MKKIMFNDKYGLTQAVLEGRKTMTRRIINNVFGILCTCDDRYKTCVKRSSRYQVGEIVAIAQSYKDCSKENLKPRFIGEIYPPYNLYDNTAGWNNKMFTKAELLPHHIRITGIRVEQLQDIPGDDCLREGIMFGEFTNTWDRYYFEVNGRNNITASTPKKAFADLIDRVSSKGTWNSNPWVFVYEFELVD